VRQIQSLGYAGVSASKSKITKSDIQHPNYDRHVTMGWNYRMPELCCAVALAQVENIDPLVERRMEVASLFNEALSGSQDLLIPQKTPEHSVNSYWTWVCKLNLKAASWNEFRDRFIQLGGDGFYGAWKLTYLEPMFVNRNLLGREYSIPEEVWSTYSMGLCPVAEDLQPRLLQFRTNYWNLDDAYKQSEVLQETIKSFC
jgi:perosamine synthetase